ncbi:KdsC family phosphatase [Luteimonas abyssi]|uniref:KdsC family phosphatase n=1 Tax=Luteimonas abyssi TaxID=1247514 RepID=UPI000737CA7B|nr:HAD hydrolase family protein [Luteimonas abyssi]
MPDYADAYPADLLARAARIRLACFDVDGTLTDGRLIYDSAGGEAKAFHVHDGQGLVLLKRAGIEVALVTARTSQAVERRGAELGITVQTGIRDKLASVQALCEDLDIGLEAVAFMGDDLPDLAIMRVAGLAAAPANAHPWTARHAHWTARAAGGEGAARECCDLLLVAQNRVDLIPGDGQ